MSKDIIVNYDGVAGLHWLTTIADEQNKDYGTAMQQYRLKRAKELGYPVACFTGFSSRPFFISSIRL